MKPCLRLPVCEEDEGIRFEPAWVVVLATVMREATLDALEKRGVSGQVVRA